MKVKFLMIILLLSPLCLLRAGSNQLNEVMTDYTVFPIQRGINISNCFEEDVISIDKLENNFPKDILINLRTHGLDHVRIPISERNILDENLSPIDSTMSLLHERISFCHRIGLKTILDLHISRVHRFGNNSNMLFTDSLARIHFMKVWLALENEFCKEPTDSLAYECLNEPAAPTTNHHQMWNDIIAEWIRLIRRKEPNRILFVGFNRGNQLWTSSFLKVPKDHNLVLTFHYYQPSPLTHYKAVWTAYKNFNGNVNYPGQLFTNREVMSMTDSTKIIFRDYINQTFDKSRIAKDLSEAVKVANRLGLQLNCSEFGCRRPAPDSSRFSWLDDMVSTFKELNISYTLWGLNGSGFGIWKNQTTLDKKMIDILLQ